MEHVGVMHTGMLKSTQDLKKYGLLFDRISMTDIVLVPKLELNLPRPDFHREIEYLRDVGFLEESDTFQYLFDEQYEQQQLDGIDFDQAEPFRQSILEFRKTFDLNLQANSIMSTPDSIHRLEVAAARTRALELRLLKNTSAVSLLASLGPVDREATASDLYEIIIRNMPIPEERVPWEDLFTFRDDETSKRQLRALRVWVGQLISGKITYVEAADRIPQLLEDFRAHMRGAGIKSVAAIIKTCVVGTATLAEATLKLRLKELAKAPFELFESRANLVEAERNAPGRQLAFIARAVDQL
jgi:hypothetical protein